MSQSFWWIKHERWSRKLCKFRQQRLQVVHFTQIIFILFSLIVFLIKLFFNHDCEEFVFIFVFINFMHSWLRSSNSEAVNETVCSSDRFFIAICGPSTNLEKRAFPNWETLSTQSLVPLTTFFNIIRILFCILTLNITDWRWKSSI